MYELKPVRVESMNPKASSRGEWVDILREFMNSEIEAAEIIGIDNRSKTAVKAARSSLGMAIRRLGVPASVKVRDFRIYLVRTDSCGTGA